MGFQNLSSSAKKRIASMGGKAAHAKGTGHEWTSKEAREAVKKTRHYKKKND